MMERFAEAGGATLTIKVPDPDLYNGIEATKVARATKAAAEARKGYSKYTRNHEISWCRSRRQRKLGPIKCLPIFRKKIAST